MHRLSLAELQRIQSEAIDHAQEGITITDARRPDNPLIFVNPGFETMTGYSSAEVIGTNCRFLQGPDKDQEGIRRIARAIRAGESIQQEILNYRKDGTPFWNELSVTPIRDGAGAITHFIGIQQDITARKEKEALKAAIAQQALIAEITLSASERQRQETGRELHDNVNQLLALAMLQINSGIRDEQARLPMLERSRDVLREVITEIRALSRRLVGPDLSDSLEVAVSRLLDSLRESCTFTVRMEFGAGVEDALSPRRKLSLYRVVQEQLHNIIKYAQAEAVLLRFSRSTGNIALSIQDNGIGFDPETSGSGGIGLQNMRGRVGLEGGQMQILSRPGAGCEICVSLPV